MADTALAGLASLETELDAYLKMFGYRLANRNYMLNRLICL